jgi:hypothetical protein
MDAIMHSVAYIAAEIIERKNKAKEAIDTLTAKLEKLEQLAAEIKTKETDYVKKLEKPFEKIQLEMIKAQKDSKFETSPAFFSTSTNEPLLPDLGLKNKIATLKKEFITLCEEFCEKVSEYADYLSENQKYEVLRGRFNTVVVPIFTNKKIQPKSNTSI